MSSLGLTTRIEDESAVSYLKDQAARRGISITRMLTLILVALQQRDGLEALLEDVEVHYRRAKRGRRAGDTHPASYGKPRSLSLIHI